MVLACAWRATEQQGVDQVLTSMMFCFETYRVLVWLGLFGFYKEVCKRPFLPYRVVTLIMTAI